MSCGARTLATSRRMLLSRLSIISCMSRISPRPFKAQAQHVRHWKKASICRIDLLNSLDDCANVGRLTAGHSIHEVKLTSLPASFILPK
jgi:hypothetical protein